MLLMFAPLRSVMAMQQSHCDTGDSTIEVSTTASVSKMHAMHDMSAMSLPDSSNQNSEQSSHQCCSDGNTCANDCDMGVAVSLLIQTSIYAPLFINVAEAENISSSPIIRELTPPSRPPAAFS